MSEGVPIQKPERSRDKCFKSRQSLLRRAVTTQLKCCRTPSTLNWEQRRLQQQS